ncbi:MAG: hypothetical protein WD491_14310 [Balneolales bacterium]
MPVFSRTKAVPTPTASRALVGVGTALVRTWSGFDWVNTVQTLSSFGGNTLGSRLGLKFPNKPTIS